MDTPTKQRLVGAAVLVALAVIFLPMLVKGPAPDSGVSDVPLDMPAEPQVGIETRELPLVTPQSGEEGVLDAPGGEGERLPTVDTAQPDASQASPASMASGDYAVHFGTYASTSEADTIVRQLRQSQLPGFREQTTLNGRAAYRVRIGPYTTRADAESARLRAAHVRDDVGARVVVLDAAKPAPAASASQPVARADAPTVASEPLPPSPKPAAQARPEPTPPAAPPAPAPAPPAAADTGFAVQVGAFGNAVEAGKLRDRLRAAGFKVFTESVPGEKGTLTRVRVGPVLTRGEADRLKAQVSAKTGVSGFVRSHP